MPPTTADASSKVNPRGFHCRILSRCIFSSWPLDRLQTTVDRCSIGIWQILPWRAPESSSAGLTYMMACGKGRLAADAASNWRIIKTGDIAYHPPWPAKHQTAETVFRPRSWKHLSPPLNRCQDIVQLSSSDHVLMFRTHSVMDENFNPQLAVNCLSGVSTV